MIRLRSLVYLSPLLGLSVLIGCGDDQVSADSTSDTGSSDDTTTATGDTTTATGDTTTATGDTTTGPEPFCGDGMVDPGEACDDGNDVEGDGCSATCTVTACGLVWRTQVDIDNINSRNYDAALGSDGDIYAVGVSVEASNVIRVTRSNPDGEVWRQTFDSQNGNDYGRAITLGADGEVYVVGSMEQDGDAMWFARLDPGDGGELWSRTVEGMVAGADDEATGVAVTADNDVIVVGEMQVGDNDVDVWLSKISAADGSELWATTWSGMGDGTYSTDRSGAVTVAEDGSIWVAAREHVDFDSQEVVAIHFGADGSLLDVIQPQASGNHTHNPVDIVAGGGGVYLAMEKSGGFPYYGWLVRLDAGGMIEWTKTELDWATIGENWRVAGLGLTTAGELNVAGTFTNEELGEQLFWGEAWIARIDADGEIICRSAHMEGKGAFLPPSLTVDGAGSNGIGAMGMTGILEAAQGPQVWLWSGYFSE